MKTLKNILTVTFLAIFTISAIAQGRVIKGTVTGIDGALEGVKVQLVNTKQFVSTNQNGFYSIEIPNEDAHLLFTLKKMNATLAIGEGTDEANILLVPAEKKLYKTIVEREELRLCDIYLKNYKDGNNFEAVKNLQEKYFFIQAYNIAAAQFSDTALRNYLKIYPDGSYKQKAEDAIEIAAWQKARFENTAESYKEYLDTYPNGKAAKMAKDKLAEKK